MAKKWRCTVCGYIHEGPEAPDQCPMCKVGKEKFVEVMEQEGNLEFVTEHVIGDGKGASKELWEGLQNHFMGECTEEMCIRDSTMLFTPQSGAELRKQIKDLIGDEVDKVREKVDDCLLYTSHWIRGSSTSSLPCLPERPTRFSPSCSDSRSTFKATT